MEGDAMLTDDFLATIRDAAEKLRGRLLADFYRFEGQGQDRRVLPRRLGSWPKKTRALDHDMNAKAILTPFGILEVASALLTITLGTSPETSDFVVDCLQQWSVAIEPQPPTAASHD